MKNKNIVNNTIMLMIFNIAKIIFPFITLPYLTRVLTTNAYGTVAYVKTIMTYMQILVDFGFVLSATKDIVNYKNNKEKLEYVVGDTLLARIILGVIGLIIILILSFTLPILRNNVLYTVLSYVVVFESVFLMDFLFRGLEKMHIITIRFILMKVISTVLTFVFIKNDSNLLWIPVLDIISSFIAIVLVLAEIKKIDLKMKFSGIKNVMKSIKNSFVYFISNVASTSFNALSTIIIGIYVSPTEVAYWSICMQIIGTIQACYSPISDGIYPEMIRSKNIKLIKRKEIKMDYTNLKERMEKSIGAYQEKLSEIRAGRANPAILNKVKVDYYGTPTPINQMAGISVPEARMIVIQPWDMSVLKDIEKAILTSDIGINPNNDGKVIRLVFPELNEERRKELVKEIKKIAEEAKVAIRSIRRDGIDEAKAKQKNSEITEDELKVAETEIQKITDKNIEEIDKILANKENEIMSV